MDELFVVVFIVWSGFCTVYTAINCFQDTTSYEDTIELCQKAGQFMYKDTVVTCQVVKPKGESNAK